MAREEPGRLSAESSKQDWEPENMQHLDKYIDVKKSSLHEAIRRFVSDLKGATAGAKPDQSDNIFAFWGVTAPPFTLQRRLPLK